MAILIGNPTRVFTNEPQNVTYIYSKDKSTIKPDDSSSEKIKPADKKDVIHSTSEIKGATLPRTGEINSQFLIIVGTIILLASGTYPLSFKRKKSTH